MEYDDDVMSDAFMTTTSTAAIAGTTMENDPDFQHNGFVA
jgi:hypothetical protein